MNGSEEVKSLIVNEIILRWLTLKGRRYHCQIDGWIYITREDHRKRCSEFHCRDVRQSQVWQHAAREKTFTFRISYKIFIQDQISYEYRYIVLTITAMLSL